MRSHPTHLSEVSKRSKEHEVYPLDPSGNLTWLLLKMGILDSYVSLPKDICRLWGVKELENSVSYNGFMEL